MKAAEIAALAKTAAERSDRDAWLALVRAVVAAADVGRLPVASRHVAAQVSEHFGGDGGDVSELAAALPRDELRALGVCLVAALSCGDALRRAAFLRAFGSESDAEA